MSGLGDIVYYKTNHRHKPSQMQIIGNRVDNMVMLFDDLPSFYRSACYTCPTCSPHWEIAGSIQPMPSVDVVTIETPMCPPPAVVSHGACAKPTKDFDRRDRSLSRRRGRSLTRCRSRTRLRSRVPSPSVDSRSMRRLAQTNDAASTHESVAVVDPYIGVEEATDNDEVSQTSVSKDSAIQESQRLL